MTIREKAIEQLERISRNLATIGEKEDYTGIAIQALEQKPCDDAISRKSMLDYLNYLHGEMPEEEFVKALPSVIPARKKGKWEMKPDPYGIFDEIPVCSECGCTTKWREKYPYCPNCGAEMEGGRMKNFLTEHWLLVFALFMYSGGFINGYLNGRRNK